MLKKSMIRKEILRSNRCYKNYELEEKNFTFSQMRD